MGAYIYKAKTQILVELTYRFEVFATLLARYIQIVAVVFLWECVYRQKSELKGMTKEQMITWIILATGLTIAYSTHVQSYIRNGVWQGNIAVDFLRPCSFMGMYLAQDIGSAITNVILRFVPTVVLGGISFHMLAPASLENGLLCIVSVLAGYLIIWLLFALIGVITFWAMELGDMEWTLWTLISILSGNLIPIYFFPQSIQNVLAWLPFQYTYQTPLALYIGKISWQEGLRQISIQLVWIVILAVGLKLLWNKMRKNILIQGG